MAKKFIIAGVGTVQMYKSGYSDYIGSTKTLTESGISFAVTEEEIRGGQGNAVIGSYYHDTGMTLNMTDALFSLDYLAMNVGGEIINVADVITTEQVTVVGGKITVTDTPKPFFTGETVNGYYKLSTEGEEDWKKIEFSGKEADVDASFNGSKVCVRYCKEDGSAKQFKVNSNFVPDQISLILTLPLFRAGSEKGESYTTSSKVGEVQVWIPNFIFNGSQDLSLTASGAATTALSGKALATFDGVDDCDSEGYYGIIKQVVYGAGEWDDVKAIVVENSDLDLVVGDVATLNVYALYNGNTAPKKLDNSKLTFTSGDSTIADVTPVGVVSAEGEGVANIEVVVTDKATLSSYAVATVSPQI